MYERIEDITSAIRSKGGVLTLRMIDLRKATGRDRLGKNVLVLGNLILYSNFEGKNLLSWDAK